MSQISNRIVFFGNEKLATGINLAEPVIKNALINAGYELEQIITGPIGDLKPHSAKIAVLVAYGQIIPKRVIDEFPLGVINIHPSLLPLHRGSTPIESVILAGEKTTGVSIMQLTDKMDAGPIFGFSELELSGTESKQYLADTLGEIGANLLLELLPQIINQTAEAIAQDDSHATYDKLITKTDGLIDWNKSAGQIEREIRAYYGWPGSYASLGGLDVIITKAHVKKSDGKPGQIKIDGSNSLSVFCKKDQLVIDELKPVGKKAMSTAEFLNGYKSRLVDL